jgi:acyl transferase domain-containing protein
MSSDSEPLAGYLMAQGGTIATSVSYYLGLKGPSLFIHTNCSSSLVALHTAYQHLRMKESSYALVAAASIYSRDRIGYLHQPGLLFSSDGHCRAFDAAADGMTIGEGVGAVLVKRAREAIADGDHIYALIRGIGVNNDGTDKAGFYAPSVAGQSALISRVLQTSDVPARSIRYVETSATGSRLGDPIEVMALENAFRAHTEERQFCAIGSVKPNIGHLDSAAGIAGLIKVALSLSHGEVPPSINFNTPNPELDLARSPFFITTERRRLARGQTPHRAALSSFGIGGTNAHAILEECPLERAVESSDGGAGVHLVPLSAKRPEGLQEYAASLLEFLTAGHEGSLASLAFTFQTGRSAFAHRVAFVVGSIEELIECLRSFLSEPGRAAPQIHYAGPTPGEGGRRLEGEDADQRVQGWMARRQFHELARCWVSGVDVQWSLLYRGSHPRRGSFPTYPFARKRYWLDDVLAKSPGAAAPPAVRQESTSAQADARPLTELEKVRAYLRQTIAAVQRCAVNDVDMTVGFFEMGLSSYELLQVVGHTERALGERISPLVPLQYPTFRELAEYLHRTYASKFATLRLDAVRLPQQSNTRERSDTEPTRPSDRPPKFHAVSVSVQPREDDSDAEPDIMREFRNGNVSMESMLALVKEDALS